MKSALWIVPLALAVGMGGWLIKADRDMRGLQAEVEDVKKQMNPAVIKAGLAVESAHEDGGQTGNGRMATAGGKVNWSGVSAMMTAAMEGDDSPQLQQSLEALQLKLAAMDTAELHQALDEIAALGLEAGEKSTLESMVVECLISKDPQGVLQRFDDRIGNDDDSVGWILSEAVGHWAQKDPMGAVKWMDAKIKEGKFDSKSLDGYSESRVEYESVLMSRLLGVQNMQAVERIRALPEGDRLVVLEQMDLTALGPDAQVAYADILRTLVPQSDREGAFGYAASELVYDGGYEAVQAFLDRVKASPEERAEAAQQAASSKVIEITEGGKPTPADIDAMRNWVRMQAPQQVDRITGEAIGEAYDKDGYLGFEDAKNLILKYHSQSQSDELLIGFVSSFAGQENPQEARKLAEMIQDPVRRQQILEELQ